MHLAHHILVIKRQAEILLSALARSTVVKVEAGGGPSVAWSVHTVSSSEKYYLRAASISHGLKHTPHGGDYDSVQGTFM